MRYLPQTSSQSACFPHEPWPKRGVIPLLHPINLPLFTSPSLSPVCYVNVSAHQFFSMFSLDKGSLSLPKTDEFSEKFQTAVNPPSFSENHVADFFQKS